MTGPAAFRPAAPVPVTLLTGFLGAGKTTLLNRLLADPALADTAVIVNEFGEVGIDHLLVETASDGLIELSGGCFCCSMRGDLAETLAGLVDRMQTGRIASLKRIVIETTGLADPVPILALLMSHPAFLQAFAPGGVVCVVDALAGDANLSERTEARRQVMVADRIVLTKTDLAEPEAAEHLRARLRTIAPDAALVDALADGAIDDLLLENAGFDAERIALASHPHRHHHQHHHHDDGMRTLVLSHGGPVASRGLREFLEALGARFGTELLRLKGIALVMEQPERPLVVHGVRGFLHPFARLPAWPAGTEPATRLVLIGEALDEDAIRDLFAAFTGALRVGAPDRAALLDNPLAVSGFSFR